MRFLSITTKRPPGGGRAATSSGVAGPCHGVARLDVALGPAWRSHRRGDGFACGRASDKAELMEAVASGAWAASTPMGGSAWRRVHRRAGWRQGGVDGGVVTGAGAAAAPVDWAGDREQFTRVVETGVGAAAAPVGGRTTGRSLHGRSRPAPGRRVSRWVDD